MRKELCVVTVSRLLAVQHVVGWVTRSSQAVVVIGCLVAPISLWASSKEKDASTYRKTVPGSDAAPWFIKERRRPMPSSDLNVLRTSRDPKALSAHARLLAQSKSQSDHAELRTFLQSNEFLNRLDTQEQYQGPPRKLRLWEVLREINGRLCVLGD